MGSSGWRAGTTAPAAATKIPSRFDTTSGPARWKDEGQGRRPEPAERWTEVGSGVPVGPQTFPAETYPSAGDRWAGTADAGRGRGRGTTVQDAPGSWKAREPGAAEWRGAGSDPAPRNDWRNDRWSTAPGSRSNDTWRGGSGGPPGGPSGMSSGFAAGRGAGFPRNDSFGSAATRAAPGSEFAARGRTPSSSFFRSFGPGGGVGGSLAWGPSKAQRRYTTDQLAFVYRQLLYSGRLKLPQVVERDDPLLFVADGDFVDVVEQFSGVDPRIAAETYLEHQEIMQRVHSRGHFVHGSTENTAGALGALQGQQMAAPQDQQRQQIPQQQQPQQHQQSSGLFGAAPVHQQQQPQAQQAQHMVPGLGGGPAADPGWVYQDPQGMLQGPFPKQDIIDWYEGGFFPLTLQLRSAADPPNAPFYPLSQLLKMWQGPALPPGFVAQQAPQQHHMQQHPHPQQEHPGFGLGPAPIHMGGLQQQMQGAGAGGYPQQPTGLPDDLLATHLQHLNIGSLGGGPVGPAPHTAGHLTSSLAPAPFDPVVDPSIVRRSPSQSLLTQQVPIQLAPQPQQAPEQQQLPLQALNSHPSGGLLGQQQAPVQELARPAWTAAPAPAPPAQSGGIAFSAVHEQEQHRLREEEERRQHAEYRAATALPPPPPPPPPAPAGPISHAAEEPEYVHEAPRHRPETKPAPWVAAVPSPEPSKGKTLLEIQAEEAERRAQLEAQQAAQAAAMRAAGPPGGGWARVARGPTASGPASGPSLLEIQQAEERAKAAAATAARQQAALAVAAGDDEDEGLFWDYDKSSSGGGAAASHAAPPPPSGPRPKAGGWAAAASKAATPAPAPLPKQSNGTTASRAVPMSALVRPPPPPPPPPAPIASPPSGGGMSFAGMEGEDLSALGDGGSSSLAGPFRLWCMEQMQELTGSRDVTLCEFLMTVESNSEVAEYVSTYLGATATAAKFSAEFLKRKLAEQAVSGKKSRKARAKATAAAAALSGAGKPASGKATVGGGDAAAASWAQVGAGETLVTGKKAKKKGQKVDTALLGFGSGTNYSLLETE